MYGCELLDECASGVSQCRRRSVRLAYQPKQLAVLFSHTKSAPATSQSAVLFSRNKSAPAISHSQANTAIVAHTVLYSYVLCCQFNIRRTFVQIKSAARNEEIK